MSIGRCPGNSQRNPEYRIGAEPTLVLRTINLTHEAIEPDLVIGIETEQDLCDLLVDVLNRLADTLAEESILLAVTQFVRFMHTGAGTTWYSGTSERTGIEMHIHLNRRVTAAIQNFTGVNGGDHAIHSLSCSARVLAGVISGQCRGIEYLTGQVYRRHHA